MKFAKLFIPAFLLSTAAIAFPMFQAGDIADGAKMDISLFQVASYYKKGTSGTVKFICDLEGKKIEATLMGGKNFDSNSITRLSKGTNGPFTWELKDNGYDAGNIKVTLLKGSHVTVQCQEVS